MPDIHTFNKLILRQQNSHNSGSVSSQFRRRANKGVTPPIKPHTSHDSRRHTRSHSTYDSLLSSRPGTSLPPLAQKPVDAAKNKVLFHTAPQTFREHQLQPRLMDVSKQKAEMQIAASRRSRALGLEPARPRRTRRRPRGHRGVSFAFDGFRNKCVGGSYRNGRGGGGDFDVGIDRFVDERGFDSDDDDHHHHDESYIDLSSTVKTQKEKPDALNKYATFRVTSFRDRDTVEQLQHMEQNNSFIHRPPSPDRPQTQRVVNFHQREASRRKKQTEKMWRVVKKKIMASAYRMGVMDFWGRFTAADKDHDGGLNRAEFSQLCRLQIRGISDEEINLVLNQVRSYLVVDSRHPCTMVNVPAGVFVFKVDCDRSGFIDYTEFLKFLIDDVHIKIDPKKNGFQPRRTQPAILKKTPQLLKQNPELLKNRGEKQFQRVVYEEEAASSISEAVSKRKLHDVSKRQAHFRVWMIHNSAKAGSRT